MALHNWPHTKSASGVYRFGPFELDSAQLELRKDGLRLRLSASRLRLLELLVCRAGQLVTREEITSLLWQDSLTVDATNGINTAVNQLRRLLGDDSGSPQFIETVIGVGYRFIATVEPIGLPAPSLAETGDVSDSKTPRDQDQAPPASSQPRIPWGRTAWLTAGFLAVVCVSVAYLRSHSARSSAVPPAEWQPSAVTDTGDIEAADVSAEGNYVAYVRSTREGRSLWLKQLATGRVMMLASIGGDECPGIAFSPDGTYIYFVRKQTSEPTGALYRVPFLGGDPTRVLGGISGEPAISPDGTHVAFVRSTLETHGEDSIVTASVDGSHQQVLATYPAPGIHLDRVAWSRDGKSLVYPLQSQLMTIAADGSSTHPVPGPRWWEIDDVRALPQCCDLVVVGQLSSASRQQVFRLSVPGGQAERLTNDLANYELVRLNGNGSVLLATQDLVVSSLQIVTPGREAQLRIVSSDNRNQVGAGGLAWEQSGRILFTNYQGILMESDEDGTSVHPIAAGDISLSDPAGSPAGDFAVAARWSSDDESAIWRFDKAPGGARQLSEGKHDLQPSITPDGRWIVYSSVQDDHPVLRKVSAQGGPSTRLTDYNADHPAVSPDGRLIACSYVARPDGPTALAVLPITGGSPVQVYPLPEGAGPWWLVWTPDGKAVSFIRTMNDVSNIWKQPLAGGPPVPVTHFTSEKIFDFRWSRDGRLLLARGTETIDVILMQPFHSSDR